MERSRNIIIDTLSDLKNGLPPRKLADRFHPKGLVFIHVPKCAGTTIENTLRRHYRLSREMVHPGLTFKAACHDLGISEQDVNDENRNTVLIRASTLRHEVLNYHLATGYKCITGHAPLGENTIQSWQDHYDFITILRDPIARYYSHLSFNYSNLAGHGQIEEACDLFLQRPRAQIMGALYVKYFSGRAMTENFHTAAAINAAKKTLERFKTVGFLESLGQFEQNVSKITKHNVKFGHDNKKLTHGVIKATPEMDKKIAEICAPDLEVYHWAKENLMK